MFSSKDLNQHMLKCIRFLLKKCEKITEC